MAVYIEPSQDELCASTEISVTFYYISVLHPSN